MACILIIDDDEAVRSATEIVLNVNGFDVVAVANAKLGIEAIKERHIDAVIIDLFMPGMDGLEATKAIRKLSSSVPIIAASGFLFGGLVSGNAELPRHGGRSWGDLDVVQAVSASGTLASDSKRDWRHRVEAADFLLARGVKLTIFFAVVAIGFA